jgi:hypothetical protein
MGPSLLLSSVVGPGPSLLVSIGPSLVLLVLAVVVPVEPALVPGQSSLHVVSAVVGADDELSFDTELGAVFESPPPLDDDEPPGIDASSPLGHPDRPITPTIQHQPMRMTGGSHERRGAVTRSFAAAALACRRGAAA